MKGGSLVLILKRCVAGLLCWNFAWALIGCELESKHGCFLGNFGMDPSWVMWNDV